MTVDVHEHTHSHDHSHDHGHDHGHSHGEQGQEHGLEGYHVQGGAPALDIGGDIGAMVVTLDSSWLGTELRLRWHAEPAKDVHTGVWERDLGGATVVAAVFAELVEGTYDVFDHDAGVLQQIVIAGGKVTELDLRS